MTRDGAPTEAIELEGAGGRSDAALLRAAISLSTITQQPFVMHWHEEESLSPDGAAALLVSGAIGSGGAGQSAGSKEVRFVPGTLRSGTFKLEVDGPGLMLSLEMLALPLALARSPSEVRLSGVSHPVNGISFHESALGWLPLMDRVGVSGEFKLDAAGFPSEAGGVVSARIYPSPKLRSVELSQRGMLVEVQAIVLAANLGIGIALPLERRLHERLRNIGIAAQVEMLPLPIEKGRGLCVVLVAQFEHVKVAFSVTGEPGQSADSLAEALVERFQHFLRHRGAVPGALASRILLPLALAASSFGAPRAIGKDERGGSRFTTTEVTGELLAIAGAVRRFLDVDVLVQGLPGDEGSVEVRPRAVS